MSEEPRGGGGAPGIAQALRRLAGSLPLAGLSLERDREAPRCAVCGRPTLYLSHRVLDSDLIAAWGLDDRWVRAFDRRESGHCLWCWANLRSRHLASAIAEQCGGAPSFRALCAAPAFRALRVAEINACGGLHRFLARCPNVTSSEYHPRRRNVRHEDLLALSYPDGAFDLCLTSETLEHVPDVRRALAEIWRVLAPGGRHIFTVPVVWDRAQSRTRVTLDTAGGLRLLAPPSYHGCGPHKNDYLVATEFGAGVMTLLEDAGFVVTVLRDPRNPALTTFITQRRPSSPLQAQNTAPDA